MTRSVRLLRGSLAALAAMAAAACHKDDVVITPAPVPSGGALFSSYVALGNSITAGYQSGGINDSTQRQSYAYLLATAMYGSALPQFFHYPSLAMPGCPPPLTSLTGTRVGNGTSTTCAYRNPASVAPTMNLVAVPGAAVIDPTAPTTPNSNALTDLVLGGSSQVTRALQAQPTFATVWIGNNDVLPAAEVGVLTATPGLSPGITDTTRFAASYKLMADSLKRASTLKGGVLIGVVNVTNIPSLFPAQALLNPLFKAGFDQYVGATTTVTPDCATSTALVSISIITFFRSLPAGTPLVISCTKGAVPGQPSVGDYFILDASEQTKVTTYVNAYNRYIAAKADSMGFAYLDPNPLLVQLKAAGAIPSVPNLAAPTNPYGTPAGTFISIDGVHPTGAAHVQIANALITLINGKYGTSLAAIH